MTLLAEFTFGHALLTVLWIFIFVAWIMVLFTIISDLFRDHDLSGWGKAVWIFFLIFVPFLTALIYLIARGSGMRERTMADQKEAQEQFTAYVQSAGGGGGSAAELEKLSALKEKGDLSQAEFEQAKAKLLNA